MRVIYDGIDMLAIETLGFSAEPVYDDTVTDYLYTRFWLHVVALVNGDVSPLPIVMPAMQYNFTGGVAPPAPVSRRAPSAPRAAIAPGGADGLDVGAQVGQSRDVVFAPATGAPLTHAAVRHRLSIPRAPLFVFAGGGFEANNPPAGFAPPRLPLAEMILASPVAPFSVDCKNGPIPRKFDVTAALGDAMTFVVEFEIETYVNEAVENNERPNSLLLSNRWKQSHAVARDGFTTVATEGLALFRTDLVYQLDTSPDVERPVLFMPIPRGFTREIDYVEGREDVTGVAYRYTDTQQPSNFVAGPFVGAADVTAVHEQSVVSDVDFLGKGAELVMSGANLMLTRKWLMEKAVRTGGGRGPVVPGAPGAGRLMVPGGPRP